MILNFIVIAFLLGMTVLWATYGMFSAFIQLLLMIVAGAIAFAVWEPVSLMLLGVGALSPYAWSIGLIGPFFVVLLVLRIACDKLVKGNMQLPKLADQILGGVFGAGAGIVTAGVTLIGLAHLPLPQALLGYQPYEVQSNGAIGPSTGDVTASLWVPADRYAARLFGYLSTRGFSSGRPLAEVYPDFFQDANTFRVARSYDDHSLLTAQPDHISITEAQTFTGDTPADLPGDIAEWLAGPTPTHAGDQIVAVATAWEHPRGGRTFDVDNILRLPPAQTQLVAEVSKQGGGTELRRFLPIGWSNKATPPATGRVFYRVENNSSMASALIAPADIVFVYAIPGDATPSYFQARNIRLPLPDPTENDPAALVAALGEPEADDAGGDEPVVTTRVNPEAAERVGDEILGNGFANHLVVGLDQSAALHRPVSANDATGLTISEEDDTVRGGKDTTNKSAGRGASARDIYIPDAFRPIRLSVVARAAAQSTVGTMVAGGTTDPEIWLEDTNGNKFYGMAYAWISDREQTISVEDIRRSSDLPLNQFKEGDGLFVYFAVPPDVPLARYHIGDNAYQEIDFTVSRDQQRRR